MTIRRAGGLVEERLSYSVIGAFFAVHRQLGFGFLESVYSRALEAELRTRGHQVSREFAISVHYRGVEIAHQRLDMVIDEKLVIEVKATERLHSDACRQLFNYLRATSLEVGLLLHFGRRADFYRVICQNHLKSRSLSSPSPSDT
ncbi:MAG TPA: GxxExxY protein [Gemmatimonadaceae bacterium]|nr:GxxExxY protein [Gemmatimonadaceae bacterium]